MGNRNMQSKLRKIQKMKRAFPKSFSAETMRVGRYNPASPIAYKTRKLRPPDFNVMESNDANALAWDDPFPSIQSANHQQSDAAALRARADALFVVARNTHAMADWALWRKQTHITEFNYVNLENTLKRRVDLWFSGPRWYFFEENYERNTHSRSLCYPSRQSAMSDWQRGNIRWSVTVPLESS